MSFFLQQKNAFGRTSAFGMGYVTCPKGYAPVIVVNLKNGKQKARFNVIVDSTLGEDGKRKYLNVTLAAYTRLRPGGPFDFALKLSRGDPVLFGGSVWTPAITDASRETYNEVICDILCDPRTLYANTDLKPKIPPVVETIKYEEIKTNDDPHDGYDF